MTELNITETALSVLAREVIIAQAAEDYPTDATRDDMLRDWEAVPEEDKTIVREKLRPALEAVLDMFAEARA